MSDDTARAYVVQALDTWASIALTQLGNGTLAEALARSNGQNPANPPTVGSTVYLTVDDQPPVLEFIAAAAVPAIVLDLSGLARSARRPRDLVISAYLRGGLNQVNDVGVIQFNGDGAANYEDVRLQASNSLAAPKTNVDVNGPDTGIRLGDITALTAQAGQFAHVEITIPWAFGTLPGSDPTHVVHIRNAHAFGAANLWIESLVGQWRSSAPISSARIFSPFSNLQPGSAAIAYVRGGPAI